MSFRPSPADRPPARPALHLPRWPRYLVPVVAGLIALGVLVTIIAGVWTDWLWYRSVGYGSVFGVTYGTRWALFFVVGIFMAATIGVNAVLAYRLRPVYRPAAATERPGVDNFRMAVDPHRRLLLGIVLGLIGVISGITASSAWRTWLLFINQVPFGRRDPQFHLDISFFVFTYPFLRLMLSYLFAAVFLSLLAAVAVHVLYGGLGWQGRRPRATMAAQAHLFVLLGVFVLLKGFAYWVDRWGIDFSQRGAVTTGASYTDVNAVLPAKTVLALIAVLCALLFFAGAVRRSALLPAVGFGLLVLSAILIGGVYPAIIQQFVVKPNELAKEYPYIHREITQTRLAYGVNKAVVEPYSGTSVAAAGTLYNEALNLPGYRLMDPSVVSRSFQQLQQVKGFYQFPGTLAVDRYPLPGAGPVPQDLVVAVRGLSGPPAGQGNWINTHLVYTHGFGLVAARENSVAGGGTPDYVESDLPPRGELGTFQPRVYFGEGENNYVIVGGPKGRPGGEELDYPYPNASGQKNTTYQGSGGVPVGSPLARLLYAIKFRELNILLSGAINGNSKILYDREPLARVAKVAPFLTLDGSPYPVVANGSIWWVVDGYTTTDLYPYSQRLSMPAATSTSQTPNGSVAGQPTGAVNYVRNSVKAVVNAYTGAVSLYQWGKPDPMLQAWMKAFPGVIQWHTKIPNYLLRHMRYPPDLFEVQRQVLAQYHVLNPQAFYGGQNFWTVPNDPTGAVANKYSQPPYYLTETIPGYRRPEFSQTTTFVPRNRANLAADMVVDSNPGPGYGTIRILALPQNAVTEGPSQVQGAFESNAAASAELTLLRRGGSIVTLGNMITIPMGGGLLYIEPVYVTAAAAGSTGSYPSLQRVFAYYAGHPVGFQPTLSAALTQVFSASTPAQPAPGGTASGGSVNAQVIADLKQAQQFYTKAQAALRNSDLATYGQDIAKMEAQIANAQAAAKAGSTAKTSPGPSPTPSPTSTASR
jgi:uncharacterized protein